MSLKYTFAFTATTRTIKWLPPETQTYSRFPSDTFASYDSAAPLVRAAAGLTRLTPSQAKEVRAAVAKHAARAARKSPAAATVGRDVAALREQLRRRVAPLVAEAFRGRYRVYALNLIVGIDRNPRIASSLSRKYVSGRNGFGWVTDSQTIRVSVQPSWRTRVLERGLSELDGLVTTHAEALDPIGDIEVYRASWVRQGRGYDLAIESGHLAYHRESGQSYHLSGGDPARAAKALGRKLTAQAIPRGVRDARRAVAAESRRRRQAAGLEKIVDRFARYDVSEISHVVVTRSDILKAGNCAAGTDEFISRFFPDRAEATLAEIASEARRRDVKSIDLTLGRQLAAACLVAIRRDRQSRRLVGV